MEKEKKYLIDNPTLMAEWNWEKNNELGLDPKILTCGSGKKAWWKCSKGHEWLATITHRNSGQGCPYCSNKKVLKGYNDLQTVNPTLSKEWDYERNNVLGVYPENVTVGSEAKVWWKCNNGHVWQARIADRNKGSGCPICTGKKVIQGTNDLSTLNSTLSKEWNYEKNGNLRPENFTVGSQKKVWWKCKKGHEWQATIGHRSKGNGCPFCNSERRTSFPEYAIEFYLSKYGIEVIHSFKKLGYELDVYIPSKKIGIEYDGGFWHKNRTQKELEKNAKCVSDNVKLYRLREGLNSLNDSSIDYIIQNGQKDLSKVIQRLLNEITGVSVDVDLKRDAIDIESLREYTEKKNSLLLVNPKLAEEWNYEKNGNLRPENFTVNSGKKVWWKCSKGHEWQARIADRSNGRNCPYCSSEKVLSGYNDLATINPKLAEEWNYEKNGGLEPTKVMPNSSKKVWWKCKNGHEWQAIIQNRNKGSGCPYCLGRCTIKGENDLLTINPKLASEWNYEKNEGLKPKDVMPNCNQKVWWKCAKGHEWQAKISNRNNGRGCPICAGKKVLQGYNDLTTTNPELAKEWNYEKNGDLKPENITAGSNKKVWWKCERGHEWESTISNRNKGSGCPYCSGLKKEK